MRSFGMCLLELAMAAIPYDECDGGHIVLRHVLKASALNLAIPVAFSSSTHSPRSWMNPCAWSRESNLCSCSVSRTPLIPTVWHLDQGIKPLILKRVLNPELRSLIELCINPDPKERPSARELLKNPYFATLRTVRAVRGGCAVC